MIVSETRSVDAQCDITFHTLRPHHSSYTSLWTHTTLPLGRVAARPVPVVACIQPANVRRCKGRSPYSPGWSGFMPSSCQHLPDKGESKISVGDVLPTTCRQKDVTVENCHVKQVEKEFFCPLPCLTAGRIAVGQPVGLVNIAQCGDCNPPQLPDLLCFHVHHHHH